MSEQAKDVVTEWVEAGWNKHEPGVADRVFHEDFVGRDPYQPDILGRAGARGFVDRILTVFDDLNIRIDDLVSEGDLVAARFTVTGRHVGEFFGLAPTGREVVYPVMSIWKVRDGKIADVWQHWDASGIVAQCGPGASCPPETLRDWCAGADDHRTVTATSSAQRQANKDAVVRWMNGAWNDGRLDLSRELATPDLRFYDPSAGPIITRDAFDEWAASIARAFPLPGRSVTLDQVLAEGDKTAFRATLRAVHGGEFLGIGPTRRCVLVGAICILQHDEASRLQRGWQVFDVLKLEQQIRGV